MRGVARRGRETVSILLWWAGLTLVMWLLGRALEQPVGLARCAASAALLVAVGEAGDRLRRRWRARRRNRAAAPTPE